MSRHITYCNTGTQMISSGKTFLDEDDIERHQLMYNRHSFWAALESPCGNGLIHDALTFSSLSQDSRSILDGEVPRQWGDDDETLKEF
jgi:hypothetical protein